jgi:hypothetical protein
METKRIQIDVPVPLAKTVEMQCVARDQTYSQYASEALEYFIAATAATIEEEEVQNDSV